MFFFVMIFTVLNYCFKYDIYFLFYIYILTFYNNSKISFLFNLY